MRFCTASGLPSRVPALCDFPCSRDVRLFTFFAALPATSQSCVLICQTASTCGLCGYFCHCGSPVVTSGSPRLLAVRCRLQTLVASNSDVCGSLSSVKAVPSVVMHSILQGFTD